MSLRSTWTWRGPIRYSGRRPFRAQSLKVETGMPEWASAARKLAHLGVGSSDSASAFPATHGITSRR